MKKTETPTVKHTQKTQKHPEVQKRKNPPTQSGVLTNMGLSDKKTKKMMVDHHFPFWITMNWCVLFTPVLAQHLRILSLPRQRACEIAFSKKSWNRACQCGRPKANFGGCKMCSVQNPCWLKTIVDYSTQYSGDYSNPITLDILVPKGHKVKNWASQPGPTN